MNRTLHSWKRFSLIEQDVRLPTGDTITHTLIQHPGSAVIIPLTDDHKIIVIRQFRPAINDWILELPAGTMEAGETPLACAIRELEEETGYSAGQCIELGKIVPLASFCDEIQHIFVAKNLTLTRRLTCDDDEVIEVMSLSLGELESLITNNTLIDAKTMAALSRAKLCGILQ